MTAWRRPLRPRCGKHWARRIRTAGRTLLLVVLALLACAALLRALVALLEAGTLLLLALAVASLALPRGLGWYWRQAQREVPRCLQKVVDSLNSVIVENKKGS